MRRRKSNVIYRQPTSDAQKATLECAAVWAAYYRANIHRFVADYLHRSLKAFQMLVLFMMNECHTVIMLGYRGIGKTFISAVFCVIRCILYPGTKICIASATRGQAINVLDKIMTELVPNSPELASEINMAETNINNTVATITFYNGSYIKVVTASDNARSNRANLLIIDEFVKVKKDVIDTVLKKFLIVSRHPKYLDNPEYAHMQERNKVMYLSSAFYKGHWAFTKSKDVCKYMLDTSRKQFICGFPYQLGLAESLLMREEVEEQMMDSEFNEISWQMEMETIFYGNTDGSFFNYEQLSDTRKIKYPMLPNEVTKAIPSCTQIKIQPKKPGEIRILSADIALMASTKYHNDATAIFVNQLTTTKAGKYVSNIVYIESNEGLHTEAQAVRIRKLFDDYDCDYIALDTRNVGLSIYDMMARDLTDTDTGEVYPAISCCNNTEIAARCVDRNAPKVVWSIFGTSKFNSDCALALREGFRTGRIRLLSLEYEGEEALAELPKYAGLQIAEKAAILAPYVNTTLTINEMINLKYEDSSGQVRLKERFGGRKDKYSSLSYNYYVAQQLEQSMLRGNDGRMLRDYEGAFEFRAPKIRR